MTSWSKYGEKNDEAGKAPFGFLGHECIGSAVCSSEHYAASAGSI